MAISANTLFHFTKLEGLKGILSSRGFYCQYSAEHFENILPSKSLHRFAYIPMTSFCDLTIMQLANDLVHRNNFGDFGIGLTKEWGIRMGVSPVMYVHKESQQTKRIFRLLNRIKVYRKKAGQNVAIDEIEQEMIDSFKYIKPYTGNWQKGRRRKKKITYYNEREWRYSPMMKEYNVLSGVIKDNKKQVEEINRKLRSRLVLFDVKDVKFIIVKGKIENPVISEAIRNIPKLSKKEMDLLITKIISFEEIYEDFG